MKIEFFEPAMCCSTGVCGPSVDEKLVKLMENIEYLKRKYEGIQIERYMVTQQPMKFKENEKVYKLVKDNGRKVLPITTVNGEVIKTRGYPTLEEMEKSLGVEKSGN
ncbi:arsenite efflux transporter metallochaperone ArsD [Wukongibacter sp. M2B1]|uniref:arsenite efflux transporter metallochaperone ArsD n=1 Tax=Wukongibacter sp. M2B1 TaxID=3088895 RepID=UPI003D792869